MAKVEDAGQPSRELLDKNSFRQEKQDQQEHLYKVLVIGDFGVGELDSSLRFCLPTILSGQLLPGTYYFVNRVISQY